MSQLVHRVTRRRSATSPTVAERTLISDNDLRSPGTRVVVAAWKSIFLVLLVLVGIFPLAWLVKAATSTTQDILGEPLGWWASGFYPENIARAWTSIKIDQYTWNTFAIALGVTFFSLLIATTGGYVLGVLKPRYAAVLNVAVMATLFVPGIIALVPLYLTIIDLPLLGISAINTFWAVWLPASVSAFNVLIVKQYFETIPSEPLRCGAGRRRRAATCLLQHRAAALPTDPRGDLLAGLHCRLEGLPVAVARTPRPRTLATVGRPEPSRSVQRT